VAGRTALSAAFPACGFPIGGMLPAAQGSETFQVLKIWKVYQGRKKIIDILLALNCI